MNNEVKLNCSHPRAKSGGANGYKYKTAVTDRERDQEHAQDEIRRLRKRKRRGNM